MLATMVVFSSKIITTQGLPIQCRIITEGGKKSGGEEGCVDGESSKA
jgi:hypothetical protein